MFNTGSDPPLDLLCDIVTRKRILILSRVIVILHTFRPPKFLSVKNTPASRVVDTPEQILIVPRMLAFQNILDSRREVPAVTLVVVKVRRNLFVWCVISDLLQERVRLIWGDDTVIVSLEHLRDIDLAPVDHIKIRGTTENLNLRGAVH
jgi:hypothetical protein